jgi:hypothetical protein
MAALQDAVILHRETDGGVAPASRGRKWRLVRDGV